MKATVRKVLLRDILLLVLLVGLTLLVLPAQADPPHELVYRTEYLFQSRKPLTPEEILLPTAPEPCLGESSAHSEENVSLACSTEYSDTFDDDTRLSLMSNTVVINGDLVLTQMIDKVGTGLFRKC